MKKQAKEQAIDNKELILALEELEKEKGIKKEYLLESIETALVTAYKRNFDSLEKNPFVNKFRGGFDWSNSLLGVEYWYSVMYRIENQ